MIRRGFTVVEIVITITIMGILLTLAVVGLNATQVNGRDSERKGDVESIALTFETMYKNGSLDSTAGAITVNGTYPGTSDITEVIIRKNTPDIDPKVLRAPSVKTTDPISLQAATNTTQTTAGVTPQPTLTTYVYQPITNTGTLCAGNSATVLCQKFNIYYRLESDNSVQMVTSKNQ